jgi:(R,R)-butanediol dehydrogenase/meso-butanediol dehydrogenase/diacetyl reductase
MRAAVYHGHLDVRVEDVHEPAEPAEGELVLDVLRGAICGTDAAEWAHGPRLISLERPHPASGHAGPVVIGHEFVGRVLAVGDGVDDFAVGDRVVSGAGVSCGRCRWCHSGRTNLCADYYTLGFQADGGLAEAVRTPAAICHPVPAACGDNAAAIAQPLAVAIHAIERAGVGPGDCVAVIGVGGIGSQVVAAAADRGARVFAADVSPDRLATADALGAAETIDATRDPLDGGILEITGGEGAQVVIEASGARDAFIGALRSVGRGGTIVALGMPADPPQIDLTGAILAEVDIITSVAHVCGSDLPAALDLLTRTKLAERVVERTVPLEDVVEDGLAPIAERRARGKILVDVQH